jgi:HAD superfamily hydrolase (TIGR01509 family)
MIPDGGLLEVWPHRIAAVAFDMDGLLINTEELYFEVFDQLMQRRGKRYTQALRRSMMGLPSPQAFDVLIQDAQLIDRADDLEEECDEIFSGVLPDRLATMPGVLQLLDRIDQLGLPRCVATSSRRAFAIDSLTAVGVLERFDFVITAEEVARGKPYPDIYLGAAQRMGVAAEQMMVLEDSQHGTRAALAAGACTIAVPGDHSRDHNFAGVHRIASSLADPVIEQTLVGRAAAG